MFLINNKLLECCSLKEIFLYKLVINAIITIVILNNKC